MNENLWELVLYLPAIIVPIWYIVKKVKKVKIPKLMIIADIVMLAILLVAIFYDYVICYDSWLVGLLTVLSIIAATFLSVIIKIIYEVVKLIIKMRNK